MGGAVRVIVKKNDIIYKQTRWTNAMPGFVNHDKFIEKDEAWWDQYINQKTYYSTAGDFSPEGYGLVIFDFDAKRIISKQGYCGFDDISYSAIWLELEGCVIGIDPADPDEFLPTIVKRMWEKEMLKVISWDRVTNKWILEKTFDGKSYDEVWNFIEKNEKKSHKSNRPKKGKIYQFKVNFHKFGWELHEFGDYTPWEKILKLVQEHYTLTDAEVKNWDNWIERDREFEMENEI